MIKKLTTKNFRKLTDHTFEFGPGLQVVRGSNEAGKSTMLEALGYALFGIKACREDLASTVTWGQPEKTLKVTVLLEVDGVDYTITRGKSGAEVNYDGGKVVGQTEVTAFVERLMGVATANVSQLMLASQGSIRGALADKPGKAMALIESLANFGVIDTVIELIQEKLLTGPTATAEDRVARAQEAVGAARTAAVMPDTSALKQEAEAGQLRLQALQSEAAARQPAVAVAQAAVDEATTKTMIRASLQAQLTTNLRNQQTHKDQYGAALAQCDSEEAEQRIPVIERQLSDAARAAELVAAHNEIATLAKGYPLVQWEGDEPSFQAAIQEANKSVAKSQAEVASLTAEQRALQAQIQTGTGKCGACGQELPNAAAVEKHNAEVKEKLLKLSGRLASAKTEWAAKGGDLEELLGLQKIASRYYGAAAKHAALIDVDWQVVPPLLRWKGEAPTLDADVDRLKLDLRTAKQKVSDAAAAKVRMEGLSLTLAEDAAAVERLQADIAGCAIADELPALRAKLEEVSSDYNFRVNAANELRYRLQHLTNEISQAEARFQQLLKTVEHEEMLLKRANDDLQALVFNNNLLKRVRAARPIIADKLWSIVLSAVSSYFSAMRGVRSVVTRDNETFKVDGQGIGGLSGSTLDILGLAIRLALTRTFLPSAPFLILDEPAAAMDEARAQATLGFLVSAGFPQTLVVTHEEMSESVAQNLITI
jgi:DNA repair exonuclease SbcCD ATPase subunit